MRSLFKILILSSLSWCELRADSIRSIRPRTSPLIQPVEPVRSGNNNSQQQPKPHTQHYRDLVELQGSLIGSKVPSPGDETPVNPRRSLCSGILAFFKNFTFRGSK